ncbi:MAG: hypothetical protein ACPGVV_01895, partial [Croceimicrobium sp.]
MGIYVKQLRLDIIRPTLKLVNLWSLSAENLLLGTAAQESDLAYYIVQNPIGPALGIYQMEPNTLQDLYRNFIPRHPEWHRFVYQDRNVLEDCEERNPTDLIWDLRFATVMTRLHYWRVPEPLPDANNVEKLATYWKKYYNTALGKGKPSEFIRNYKHYILSE